MLAFSTSFLRSHPNLIRSTGHVSYSSRSGYRVPCHRPDRRRPWLRRTGGRVRVAGEDLLLHLPRPRSAGFRGRVLRQKRECLTGEIQSSEASRASAREGGILTVGEEGCRVP